MRELVIVISDFYVPVSATTAAPADEHALAGLSNVTRFGTSAAISDGWRAWLTRWVDRADLADAAPATVAAVAMENAPSVDRQSAMTWLAEPVYLMAGLRNVHMDFTGLLRLTPDTQRHLVSSFEADFAHSPYKLAALSTGGFALSGPAASALADRDPARCLGSTIESVIPSGRETASLQRLAGELEMWLHAHPINVARARDRQRPITTLWLWGGGPSGEEGTKSVHQHAQHAADASLPHAIYSGDAYVAGLARALGTVNHAVPLELNDVLAQGAKRTAVVVEAFRLPDRSAVSTPLQALQEIDRRWIAPAFDALAGGSIARLIIVANDRVLSVRSRDRMKLWRRKRGALAGWQ